MHVQSYYFFVINLLFIFFGRCRCRRLRRCQISLINRKDLGEKLGRLFVRHKLIMFSFYLTQNGQLCENILKV